MATAMKLLVQRKAEQKMARVEQLKNAPATSTVAD
jgi:hypothetical protein